MAIAQLAEEAESTLSLSLLGRAPTPFIGVLDLFPQISWREGLPHGDEGGRIQEIAGFLPDRILKIWQSA